VCSALARVPVAEQGVGLEREKRQHRFERALPACEHQRAALVHVERVHRAPNLRQLASYPAVACSSSEVEAGAALLVKHVHVRPGSNELPGARARRRRVSICAAVLVKQVN
jgi:hypothetical protein